VFVVRFAEAHDNFFKKIFLYFFSSPIPKHYFVLYISI
jgi:hypothetical protein